MEDKNSAYVVNWYIMYYILLKPETLWFIKGMDIRWYLCSMFISDWAFRAGGGVIQNLVNTTGRSFEFQI